MLKDKLKDYVIVLASGSPRRQQFMKDLDLDFIIRTTDVDEVYPDTLRGAEITDFLAELKAGASTIRNNEIVITSDTIVWHEDKALGKPKDYDDALQMLLSLSGKTHEVITSVCIRTTNSTFTFNDVTKVTFNTLTEDEVKYYLNNYKPYDKAGAYGIQEWIGLVAIATIEGSYVNVVGLPVDKLYQHLKAMADR